tara:strand:- start:231 stop:1385 length:1155 start_codon:yes stop_codon:yes gene_type:complete
MRKRKNILILSHHPAYIPRRPFKTGLALSQIGYNVSILIPYKRLGSGIKIQCVNDKLTLYFCPTILGGGIGKGADPIDLITRLFIIKKINFDLIFAFDTRPTVVIPALYYKLKRHVPLIIDQTDWWGQGGTIKERSGVLYSIMFSRIETFFEEFFLKFADGFTVICKALKKRLIDRQLRQRIYFYPLGCAPERLIHQEVNQLKKQLGLPTVDPLIGCLGSLFPVDADLLFNSFNLLKKEIPSSLVLIGHNNLEHKYKIPNNIITTGDLSRQDLLNYVHCCDLMVVPMINNLANNGRWPSKINDYLTMGKPVVSTKIEVVKYLFSIYEFGKLADDNEIDFADKIMELLLDDQKKAVFRKNAQSLCRRLEWKRVVGDLVASFPEYF